MSPNYERRRSPGGRVDERIESRIAVHDSNHVEIKLDYTIDSRERSNRYRVATYLFIPKSLGINAHSYPKEQLYCDLQSYIRLKTPSSTLETIADADDLLSPLGSVDSLLGQLELRPKDTHLRHQIGHELRMFACIVRARLRDHVRAFRGQLRQLQGHHQPQVRLADLTHLSTAMLRALGNAVQAWRQRRPRFMSHSLPRELCEIYRSTDEYLSGVLEEKLTSLIDAIDRHGRDSAALLSVRDAARARLMAESTYQRGAGYAEPTGTNDETFLFRRGLLKKLVMSVLWLEIDKQREGAGAAQLGAAIAAGAAMFVALVVTVLHARWYMINTWPFIIAATVTYMLKDRVKDFLKSFFQSRTSRWLADYSVSIRDPTTDRSIGRCRESVGYVAVEQLPAEVLAARFAEASSHVEARAKPELVLKYEKSIRVSGPALVSRGHLHDYDVNDIVRLSLAQFLLRADDPRATLAMYDPECDRITRRAFRKVYHLNIVMVFRAGHARCTPLIRHFRVVFDKKGIRRLEERTRDQQS